MARTAVAGKSSSVRVRVAALHVISHRTPTFWHQLFQELFLSRISWWPSGVCRLAFRPTFSIVCDCVFFRPMDVCILISGSEGFPSHFLSNYVWVFSGTAFCQSIHRWHCCLAKLSGKNCWCCKSNCWLNFWKVFLHKTLKRFVWSNFCSDYLWVPLFLYIDGLEIVWMLRNNSRRNSTQNSCMIMWRALVMIHYSSFLLKYFEIMQYKLCSCSAFCLLLHVLFGVFSTRSLKVWNILCLCLLWKQFLYTPYCCILRGFSQKVISVYIICILMAPFDWDPLGICLSAFRKLSATFFKIVLWKLILDLVEVGTGFEWVFQRVTFQSTMEQGSCENGAYYVEVTACYVTGVQGGDNLSGFALARSLRIDTLGVCVCVWWFLNGSPRLFIRKVTSHHSKELNLVPWSVKNKNKNVCHIFVWSLLSCYISEAFIM